MRSMQIFQAMILTASIIRANKSESRKRIWLNPKVMVQLIWEQAPKDFNSLTDYNTLYSCPPADQSRETFPAHTELALSEWHITCD